MALLTALVAEVMKRAAKAVHAQLREGTPTRSALNQVAKTIADSKLGQKAGEWFRDNFDKIQEAVRKHQEQRQKRLEQGQDSGSNTSLTSSKQSTLQRPEEAVLVPASRVATRPNTAFFWSGRTNGIGGASVAGEFAAAENGTTLEQLIE